MRLLRMDGQCSLSVRPGAEDFAAYKDSMKKLLQSEKLRNMLDMSNAFIPRDRWPSQLEGMSMSYVENENALSFPIDQRAAMLASQLQSTGLSSLAQILSLLRRDAGASTMPEEVITRRLCENLHFSVRTLPRRQRT